MQNFVGKTKCIAGYMKVANYGAILPAVPCETCFVKMASNHDYNPSCSIQLYICRLFHSSVCFLESSLRPISCDVVVVGGGISGMYMAETLMRMKKEDNVCLFEKDSRFGGRDYDYRFSQAPNISISKLVCRHFETQHAGFSCFLM